MEMVFMTKSECLSTIADLRAFVHRVASNEKATPAELAALPGVASVLLSGHEIHWYEKGDDWPGLSEK